MQVINAGKVKEKKNHMDEQAQQDWRLSDLLSWDSDVCSLIYFSYHWFSQDQKSLNMKFSISRLLYWFDHYDLLNLISCANSVIC